MAYTFNPLSGEFDYYQASSGNTTVDPFTTTGGVQILTLSHTPIAIILVVLNGQILTETDDYTATGSTITLTNTNIPAGLKVKVVYNY